MGAAEFAALMAPHGPFVFPIAVACSGGPDSLALTWLAHQWAGGRVLALVVDHGLRAGSDREAALVAAQLAGRGIAARVLALGLPGGPGLQARARAARRAALLEACRAAGAVHLLLGHHARDQAETIAFRALRGSGAAGLAGMAARSPAPEALILRPLLAVPPERLHVTCAAAGLQPVQDPSNADLRFARARLRQAVGWEGLGAAPPAFAARRARDEGALLARAAICLRLLPEGCAFLDCTRLGQDATARALLGAVVRMVGGREHAPPIAALARLLAAGQGSLGGALWRGGWVVREALAPAAPAHPGAIWDGRFRLGRGPWPAGCRVAAAGGPPPGPRPRHLPARAVATLPALVRGDAILAKQAHLPYRDGLCAGLSIARFVPVGGPLPGEFFLAAIPEPGAHTISRTIRP